MVTDKVDTKLNEMIIHDLLLVPIHIRDDRHVCLSSEDCIRLFGNDVQLTVQKELSGDRVLYREKITLVGPKGSIENVALIGPFGGQTYIELQMADRWNLGVEPPVKESGTALAAPTLTIVGPMGSVVNYMNGIIMGRHMHMDADRAKALGLKNKAFLSVETRGNQPVILKNIQVTINNHHYTEFHLTGNEAEALEIESGDNVKIVL